MAQVCLGYGQVLARTPEGACYAWGRNNLGQCGLGGDVSDAEPTPRVVESLREVEVAQVAAGCFHSMVLSAQGPNPKEFNSCES
jgi:alpha-tubulin suppressor-like RCC1 family protein